MRDVYLRLSACCMIARPTAVTEPASDMSAAILSSGSAGCMALLLKPSEYTGQKGTAVAGRVVILTHQEVKAKASTADAAAPRHGKGSKGKKIADKPSLKLEMHLAGTDSINEVLYVEAWGEQADHLKKKLTQGDLVSIAGATHIPAAQNYSTSRWPYHLRVYRGSQRHCAEAGRFALVECAKLASFGAALCS